MDDNQRIRNLIKKHLVQLNVPIEIHEYENGESAVAEYLNLKPELILMDIMMKGVDGFAATKEIRKLSTNVKIIVVTQLSEEEYRAEAIKYGANDYINKENLSLLVTMIRNNIKP